MRLHLVDGTFELFRAHYTKRPGHRSLAGQEVKATVGLAASLLGLLTEEAEAVTHVAIAFDNPIVSFRNELYAEYKSDEGVDPELRAQFDLAEEAARALGVVVWSMDRWEADDALATAAARFSDEVEQVRILTPDKDLAQCLNDRVVLIDRVRNKLTDPAAFRERRGFDHALMPDFLALVGDTADGIPGITGFGEKSAATLLARFGPLEEIPKDPALWEGVRRAPFLANALAECWEEALLYRHLATLVRDVPLKESLADLEHRGVPRAVLLAWCERMNAGYLAERPKEWARA